MNNMERRLMPLYTLQKELFIETLAKKKKRSKVKLITTFIFDSGTFEFIWNDCRYICKLTWIIHAFKTFLWSNKSEMQIVWFYCNVSKMNFTCDAWWPLHAVWYMFVKSQCFLLLNLFRITSIFHFFEGIWQKIEYLKVSILFVGVSCVVFIYLFPSSWNTSKSFICTTYIETVNYNLFIDILFCFLLLNV